MGVCVCVCCKAQTKPPVLSLTVSVSAQQFSQFFFVVVLWSSGILSHDAACARFIAHPLLKHEKLDIFGCQSNAE